MKHITPDGFLCGQAPREQLTAREQFTGGGIGFGRDYQQDGKPWVSKLHTNRRSGDDGRVWLSSLVDTMEVVASLDVRATPCDARLLSAVRRQLARPVSTSVHLQPELIQPTLPPDFSLRT